MIIVDTNVVSEVLKPRYEARVQKWLDDQFDRDLYLTAITLAELLFGIERLPEGRRRNDIEQAVLSTIDTWFGSRILPFTKEAAKSYAIIAASAASRGATIALADGQIAAIASVHGFTVATREVRPFAAAGVPVINPWQAED